MRPGGIAGRNRDVGEVEAWCHHAGHKHLPRAGRLRGLPLAVGHEMLWPLPGGETAAEGDDGGLGGRPVTGSASCRVSGPPACHSQSSSERTACQHDTYADLGAERHRDSGIRCQIMPDVHPLVGRWARGHELESRCLAGGCGL
jgi:hypothetical protein